MKNDSAAREADFIIIGAMKCATSTLHDQLAAQPGVFVTDPKEPNFFSDNDVYARGLGWYRSLFQAAGPEDLCGESSTHYTKLPTHPRTVERLRRHVPGAKLIYVMRHPIDRLVSQYIHEWTERATSAPLDGAIDELPRLVDYSRYSMQARPYLEAFGAERVLPVFFERLIDQPQAELDRVARYIGLRGRAAWQLELHGANVSAERLRKSRWRDALVRPAVLARLRRTLVPKSVRESVKRRWQMRERPTLTEQRRRALGEVFDRDLAELGALLGMPLTCESFRDAARAASDPRFVVASGERAAPIAARAGGRDG